MILGHLDDIFRYSRLHPRLSQGLAFLAGFHTDLFMAGQGKIDGSSIFVLRQTYKTKPRSEGKWEAHRRYADIQCVYCGEELVGYAPMSAMRGSHEYVAEHDYALYEGDGQFFLLRPGTFVIFLPEDVHMPAIAPETPAPVCKLVVKVEL